MNNRVVSVLLLVITVFLASCSTTDTKEDADQVEVETESFKSIQHFVETREKECLLQRKIDVLSILQILDKYAESKSTTKEGRCRKYKETYQSFYDEGSTENQFIKKTERFLEKFNISISMYEDLQSEFEKELSAAAESDRIEDIKTKIRILTDTIEFQKKELQTVYAYILLAAKDSKDVLYGMKANHLLDELPKLLNKIKRENPLVATRLAAWIEEVHNIAMVDLAMNNVARPSMAPFILSKGDMQSYKQKHKVTDLFGKKRSDLTKELNSLSDRLNTVNEE